MKRHTETPREPQLPEKNVVEPITFTYINVDKDPTAQGIDYNMNVLFLDHDGSNNSIFEGPNAYNHVINEVNRVIYDYRCLYKEPIQDGTRRKQVSVEHTDFYNKVLSANVINKMLDEIEFNCSIICESGIHSLTKNFFTCKGNITDIDNSVSSIIRFDRVRSRFGNKYFLMSYDMLGEYVIFDNDPEGRFRDRVQRPDYSRDNNVLDTMLNLKAEILSILSFTYGQYINFVINTGAYDICALAKFLMGNEYDPAVFNESIAISFIVSCLNEQASRDIAKMGDMIEISLISALHYFMNNAQFVPDPQSLKDLPGIKNYMKLPDGSEIGEF